MTHYPIVEHRELRPFVRWSARRQRRHPLTAGEFETLVYEVGSTFVETEPAARAKAVSVVDLRHNVRLEVRHGHVTAVFRCTVEDPVAVATARRRTSAVRDLQRFLTRGLSAMPGFPRRISPETLAAWREEMPNPVPGMRIVLTHLHVPSGSSSHVSAPDDDDYTEA